MLKIGTYLQIDRERCIDRGREGMTQGSMSMFLLQNCFPKSHLTHLLDPPLSQPPLASPLSSSGLWDVLLASSSSSPGLSEPPQVNPSMATAALAALKRTETGSLSAPFFSALRELSVSSVWSALCQRNGWRQSSDKAALFDPLHCRGGRENSAAEIKLVWGSGQSGRQRWSAGGARCGETLAPLQLPLLACRATQLIWGGGGVRRPTASDNPPHLNLGNCTQEDDLFYIICFLDLLKPCVLYLYICILRHTHKKLPLTQAQDGLSLHLNLFHLHSIKLGVGK